MKISLVALFLVVHGFDVCAQDFKLDTLVFHGATEKRINLVILGDGYLSSQLTTFSADAEELATRFLNTSPFKEYKNQFNVFAIPVASNVEGAGSDPATPIDNYFGSVFNFGGIARLLVPLYSNKINDVLASTFPTYDLVIMIVNSPIYGGSGGWVATCSKGPSAWEVALHEIGHTFSALADEYWAGDIYAHEAPNMTSESSPQFVRWKNWLNDEGIGIIPYSTFPWYKPADNTCMMESLNNPYCAVCREQIVRTIHELSSPIDHYALNVAGEELRFELATIQPQNNTLKIKWFVNASPIQNNSEKFNVSRADLSNGTNEIAAAIFDSTRFDRRDNYYLTTVTWEVGASVIDEIQKTLVDREEVITSTIKPEETTVAISLFPNPVKTMLNLTYSLKRQTEVKTSLCDANGKIIVQRTERKSAGTHTQQFDFAKYSDGLYIVKMRIGNVQTQLRVIKEG